jgi:thiamine biosynthesis lipoprotein
MSSLWLYAGAASAAVLTGAASAQPAVAAPAPVAAQAAPYSFHYDHVLGTSLDITVLAGTKAGALIAADAATREIARLDLILSAWRPDGELARLNATGVAAPSPELRQVLARCEHWRRETGGAFDCRVGGALSLWRAAAGSDAPAPASALQAALADAQSDAPLDGPTVRRPKGASLTVDGLAKGYIVDAALHAARRASPSLSGLMINIGGDLRCWGQAPQAGGWRVGVSAEGEIADNATPKLMLRVADRAVAASGRGARDFSFQGCAVSHTLIPATGQPAQTLGVVVTAKTAADADALATAFMVMQPRAALALADRLDGVETLITGAAGERYASAHWDAQLADTGTDDDNPPLLPARLITALGAAAAPAAAHRGFGLDLTYEVPQIDADPYHAPYVAAWITDENHQLVRTLLLLGKKPKWAPENYIWWRRYGRETPGVLDAIAKPTRAPGRYTAHWDGADEAGKAVPPGRYTLHIEAAREKGGHSYESADIDLGGPAGAKTLLPKDELGALELRYGPAQ